MLSTSGPAVLWDLWLISFPAALLFPLLHLGELPSYYCRCISDLFYLYFISFYSILIDCFCLILFLCRSDGFLCLRDEMCFINKAASSDTSLFYNSLSCKVEIMMYCSFLTAAVWDIKTVCAEISPTLSHLYLPVHIKPTGKSYLSIHEVVRARHQVFYLLLYVRLWLLSVLIIRQRRAEL